MELAALRESLRRLAPNAVVPAETNTTRRERMSTGWVELDRLLAGGLPRGGITEICGETSSGKTSLALAMAASRTTAGELVAYLDGQGQLYPPAAAAMGVDLARFLVVSFRGSTAPELDLARAADVLIRSRRFPLILIDAPQLLSSRRAARLRQSAHATGAVLARLGDRHSVLPGAAARLQVWPHRRAPGSGSRTLEVHIDKGSRRQNARAVIELDGHRIDHAPGRALAPVLRRTAPGVPPEAPARDRRQRPIGSQAQHPEGAERAENRNRASAYGGAGTELGAFTRPGAPSSGLASMARRGTGAA